MGGDYYPAPSTQKISAKRLIHSRPLSDLHNLHYHQSRAKRPSNTIMDFDYDGFFEVENIINAIFNGVPPLAEKDGEVSSAQGYSATTGVTLPLAASLPSAALSPSAPLLPPAPSSTSLRSIVGVEPSSWSSASTLPSGDGDAQTRQSGKAPPSARSVENPNPPNLYTDIGRHLLLAPG